MILRGISNQYAILHYGEQFGTNQIIIARHLTRVFILLIFEMSLVCLDHRVPVLFNAAYLTVIQESPYYADE